MNAIESQLNGIKIDGCYFHFAQNLCKNIQKLGLATLYLINIDIRKSFKQLKALCFIPTTDVIDAFKYISKNAPLSFNKILIYFEKILIGKPSKNKEGVRTLPPYPIKLWNCYVRIKKDHARTYNSIEAWHKQFEVLIN